jgi:hypothetical protein
MDLLPHWWVCMGLTSQYDTSRNRAYALMNEYVPKLAKNYGVRSSTKQVLEMSKWPM